MIPILAAAATPLIQSLMKNGISALAGAVANKGKEYVEEKLGVKIPEEIDEKAALELKQLEFDHAEELERLALENRKLDLEELKAGYADTDSARSLGQKLSESQYWLNGNIVPILALLTILSGMLMLWFSTNSEVRMAAVSFVMMPLGYYFGSSSGSKAKQAVIEKGLK